MSVLKNEDNPRSKELRNVINEAYHYGFILSNYSHMKKEKSLNLPEEYIDENGYFDEDYIELLNEEQKDFIFKRKTMYNKICSCMDWFDVAKETLSIPEFYSCESNESSAELISFISKCELLISSVENLWDAVVSDMGIQSFNFESSSIFNANEFGKQRTDRFYFKLLRAWFGVHGVDGYERKVKIEINGEEKYVNSKFFSSWSCFDRKDPYIILYSEIREAEKVYGGRKVFETDKIIELVNFYYNSLEILIDRIKEELTSKDYDVER